MSEQFRMLDDMYSFLTDHEGLDKQEAFEALVEWIALQISADQGMTMRFLQEFTNEQLHNHFEPGLLKQEMRDWLGLFQEHLGLAKYTDEADAKQFAATLPDPDPGNQFMPKPFFFDRCRTGRHIMEHFRKLGDSAIYYGMEPDPVAYHIALVNATLYGIPAQLVNADPLIVESSLKSKNWFLANSWFVPDPLLLEMKEVVTV